MKSSKSYVMSIFKHYFKKLGERTIGWDSDNESEIEEAVNTLFNEIEDLEKRVKSLEKPVVKHVASKVESNSIFVVYYIEYDKTSNKVDELSPIVLLRTYSRDKASSKVYEEYEKDRKNYQRYYLKIDKIQCDDIEGYTPYYVCDGDIYCKYVGAMEISLKTEDM